MQSVDLAEAAQFRKLAPEWWDPKGPCQLLHVLNPTRLQFVTDRCRIEGRSILDIGCGGGIFSQSLAQRGAQVIGIDVVPELLAVAENQALKENVLNLRYEQSTAEAYARLHPQSFDIIVCMELLEHVPHPLSVIQAIGKLLKPGGHLFCSTLNRHFKAYIVGIIGAEYLLKKLPLHTHHFSKFIRPSELAGWMRDSDLKLQEFAGIFYNPLTHRAKITQDLSVNYLAHALLC